MQATAIDSHTDAIEPAPLLPRITGYRVIRRLGMGGMANVYLAVQESLEREVALKVMRPSRQLDEAESLRFEHEARIIAKLEHPGIVGIHEVGRTLDGELYYVMPYLARGDLGERDYRDDEAGLIELLRVLLDALGYAHARGIVHRDVKAENVLFDNADRPQLADFGIALAHVEGDVRVTGDGLAIGSSAQMSPEQARAGPIDGRSDLYSLGVLTFELLTGQLPYHATDPLALALMHAHDPIPRLPDDKAHWQRFIDLALAKRPEQRFRNAQAMQRALDPIRNLLRRRASPLGRARDALNRQPALLVALGVLLALSVVTLALPSLSVHEPVATPVPVSAPVAESVDTGLAARLIQAREQLDAGALLEPSGANAAQSYFDVLGADPDNTEARAGLEAVIAAAAPGVIDSAKTDARERIRERYLQIELLADHAALRDGQAFVALRAGLAGTILDRARALIRTQDVEPVPGWLELARELGVAESELIALRDAAAAVPRAGDIVTDRGGLALVHVPRRHGNSTLPAPLLVMRDEVSRASYAEFAAQTARDATRCRNRLSPLRLLDRRDWKDPGFRQGASEPVVCVSFDDARAYAGWLSRRNGHAYRLPTMAEWRHLAGTAATRASSCAFGNVLDESSNVGGNPHACSDDFAYTAPPGRHAPAALGINDLFGNVAEWVLDCGNAGNALARTLENSSCPRRATIGLSWRDETGARADTSRMLQTDRGFDDVGFRLVRSL